MPKTTYTSLSDISTLQTAIMHFVDDWIHEKKTLVPLKEIIAKMTADGENKDSVIYSLKILVKKGYLRRSSMTTNKTLFIQLRRVNGD